MNLSSLNQSFLKKARTATYFISTVLLALTLVLSFKNGSLDGFALANYAGFLTFTFLCLALAVTPFRIVFPSFPLNPSFYLARRSLGVSAFGFALVHFASLFVFVFESSLEKFFPAVQASGFGIPTGTVSLFFLFVLALTSTDFAVKKLGKNWFSLHKLAYLAYPLIVLHVVLIGIDFQKVNAYSGAFFVVAVFTLALE